MTIIDLIKLIALQMTDTFLTIPAAECEVQLLLTTHTMLAQAFQGFYSFTLSINCFIFYSTHSVITYTLYQIHMNYTKNKHVIRVAGIIILVITQLCIA